MKAIRRLAERAIPIKVDSCIEISILGVGILQQ
jgi:hypothetical protein